MTTTYTAYAGDTQQIEIDVGDEAGAPRWAALGLPGPVSAADVQGARHAAAE